MKILTIPDAHVGQGQDNTRFTYIGKLILKERPDAIITMGDFASMRSISHWDKDKRLTMEGRRYREDISSANEALDLMLKPLYNLQQKQKFFKSKMYKPQLIYLEGNHEYWVHKYLEQNPAMEGQIGIDKDLHLTERGFVIIPYKDYIELDGVLFTHVPMDGSFQAIKGANICQTAARYVAKSCVFAHTHRLEYATITRVGSDDIQILTSGCFFEDELDSEEFGINRWKGVQLIDIFRPGRFDYQTISLETLSSRG